jgi:hypothetical protein
MGRLVKTALIAGMGLAMPAMSMAADVPQPPIYYPPPPVEMAGAPFYFRIDVGFKRYRTPAATFNLPALGYVVPGTGGSSTR